MVSRLCEVFAPITIYLFGSYAGGTPGPHSDIDLLVIVENSDLDPYERDARAYLALCGLGVAKDVQVYTRSEFEEQASLPSSFARTVRTRGRILYER
ncbi:MAG: nucleotidyltransferase domain-containing protein [Planctomycetes bacterium]|nr:nucleotidyltransferase domain-containing protein [Planctomycetota bacterium]